MMFPGDTESHRFEIPFPIDAISGVCVTYQQNNYTILEKTFNKMLDQSGVIVDGVFFSIDDNRCGFEYKLSQQESLKFADNIDCYIQVNVTSSDGSSRFVATPIRVHCGEQYHRGVIS